MIVGSLEKAQPMNDWDPDDLAYAAGFMDGEGSFVTSVGQKITVTVSNTNRPVIEWFQRQFGGSLTVSKRHRRPNHRTIYRWQAVATAADRFCKAIAGYLHEKAPQCLALIAIRQLQPPNKRRRSSIQIAEQKRLEIILKEYKHVSWD